MLSIPAAAAGAVFASLIAGTVSLIGLIISKEQKISEFRQNWIDELRNDIANLIARINSLHGSSRVPWKDVKDAWADTKDDLLGLNDVTGKIRLRLNPEEHTSKRILDTIEEIEAFFFRNGNGGSVGDPSALNVLQKRLVVETNAVLKAEWKRVKSGEPIYRIARLSALAVISSIVACSIAVLGYTTLVSGSYLFSR
ncbi:hypothetical protein DTW90_14500 [Neorhizobium sp. P12A]|uniref:hypothetical protein n=1 Tax=Neorhizobium sp. P12A TaxID=2268027 RepID=UPI0011EF2947|nr:hypothetical protein [Neorhizobium sp. P12A]KAA0698102.1 hypothetical protein DTW90_14500 [Neorhizobium sp. P12A]